MVNPHVSAADTNPYNYNPRDEGYLVSQAMLALAYEQRTANLIAWRNAGKNLLGEGADIDDLIRKRLDRPSRDDW
jgi:hypothetical protein